MVTIIISRINYRIIKMTKLNELKSGRIARVVAFENGPDLKSKLESMGIFEGMIVRIISSFGLIIFSVESKKIFKISNNIAKRIRIIELNCK